MDEADFITLKQKEGKTPPEPLSSYASRPKRSGKWFIMHKTVSGVRYQEKCDVMAEFLSKHPSASKLSLMKDFVAIRLDEEQIAQYTDIIRLSSYRWDDVRGCEWTSVAERPMYEIPSNFGWFLELIKKQGYIGWIDFMSNIGVNAPKANTLNYMGGLYANQVTVGAWLYSLDALNAGITRAWIYQETAFGALDPDGVASLLRIVRASGQRLRGSGTKDVQGAKARILEYFNACHSLAKLLVRRGFDTKRTKDLGHISWSDYPDMHCANPDRLVRRMDGDDQFNPRVDRRKLYALCSGSDPLRSYIKHLIGTVSGIVFVTTIVMDYYSRVDKEHAVAEAAIKPALLSRSYEKCTSVNDFFQDFANGLLQAYYTCNVTFANDRPKAVTAVASFIATELSTSVVGGRPFNEQQTFEYAWKGLCASELQIAGGGSITTYFQVSNAIGVGNHFPGFGEPLKGALIGNATEQPGFHFYGNQAFTCSYRTAEGGLAEFSPQKCMRATKYLGNDEWECEHLQHGRRVKFYYCSPPRILHSFPKNKLVVAWEVGTDPRAPLFIALLTSSSNIVLPMQEKGVEFV